MVALRRLARREALALALLALAVRLLPPLLLGPERFHASGYHYYVEMADHVLAGEGLHRTLPFGQGDRHAIRTPLYPLLLAGIKALPVPFHATVALVGALFGVATVLLARALARRLFGERAGLLAGLAVALWPHSVAHDAALQDTAAYTAVLAGLVLLTVRRVQDPRGSLASGAARGLLGAMAVLVRAPLLPAVVVLAAWPAAVSRRAGREALVALAALLLGLSPWLLRNAAVVGAPVVTSDAGRSLWLGNNPQTFSVYPRQSIDRAEERAWAALPQSAREHVRGLAHDELASDAWFRAEALRFARERPLDVAAGAARKAWATFSPWWNPEGPLPKQLAHLVAWLAVVPAACACAWLERRRWREIGPLLVVGLGLAAQSAVFFGHSSYRACLDPLLVVLASRVARPRVAEPS